MPTRTINPWRWSQEHAFQQAVEVTGSTRTLFCSGQASVDETGEPLHVGDLAAQTQQALSNVETVLQHAGMALGNIVRLTIYTTDVEAFLPILDSLATRFEAEGIRESSTLVGVTALAFPGLMVELEATAVA